MDGKKLEKDLQLGSEVISYVVSKKFVNNEKNIQDVLKLYLESENKPSLVDIANQLSTTYQNVRWIVANYVNTERLKAEKRIRYSRSKIGDKNPMLGKSGFLHSRYIGLCHDKNGYLTRQENGKRVFEHRRVIAKALGLKEIPEFFDVHHLNGDKQATE